MGGPNPTQQEPIDYFHRQEHQDLLRAIEALEGSDDDVHRLIVAGRELWRNITLVGAGGVVVTSQGQTITISGGTDRPDRDHVPYTLVVGASNSKDNSRADFVCSGADDQVTISQAVASLPAAGGTVALLEGDYSIGDTNHATYGRVVTLAAKSNVRIVGNGRGTRLVRKSHSTGSEGLFQLGPGTGSLTYGVSVENLFIDGNRGTLGTGGGDSGVRVAGNFNETVLRRLWVENVEGTGIALLGGEANQILDSTVKNLPSGGSFAGVFGIDDKGDRTVVRGNDISDCQAGIAGGFDAGTVGNLYLENRISDVYAYGVYLFRVTAGGAVGNSVDTVTNGHGIVFDECASCAVSGGAVKDPFFDGVLIAAGFGGPSPNNTVSGVTVLRPGQDGIATVGQRTSIGLCTVRDAGRYGYSIGDVSNHGLGSTCVGNVAEGFGATDAGIAVFSDGNIVVANNLTDTSGGAATSYGVRIWQGDANLICSNSAHNVLALLLDGGTNTITCLDSNSIIPASSLSTRWELLVTGSSSMPELIWFDSELVYVEVPT